MIRSLVNDIIDHSSNADTAAHDSIGYYKMTKDILNEANEALGKRVTLKTEVTSTMNVELNCNATNTFLIKPKI